MEENKREFFIDGIKGIACLFIMIGHFTGIYKYSQEFTPNIVYIDIINNSKFSFIIDELFWLYLFFVIIYAILVIDIVCINVPNINMFDIPYLINRAKKYGLHKDRFCCRCCVRRLKNKLRR